MEKNKINSVFYNSVSHKSNQEQRKIKDLLRLCQKTGDDPNFSKWSVWAKNLMNERFLAPNAMKRILDIILKVLTNKKRLNTDTLDALEKALLPEYRKIGKLQGGKIKGRNPDSIYSIVAKSRMVILYTEEFKYWQQAVYSFFENIPKYLERNPKSFNLLKPSKHLVWVTWCENYTSDPFSFSKIKSKNIILNFLGIDDDDYLFGDVLAFIFDNKNLSRDFNYVFRPTVCDAEFSKTFCPPGKDVFDHGLTMPLDDFVQDKGQTIKTSRQPEGVIRSKNLPLNYITKSFSLH